MKPSEVRSLTPTVHPERCTRVRFSEAQCRSCLSVCPSRSIRVAFPTLEIDRHCTGCGFCAGACPNEVFEFPAHGLSSSNFGAGSICCSALLSEPPAPSDRLPPSITPCHGSVSTAILLGSILREGRPLDLLTGSCEVCPRSMGMSLFQERTAELQSLFDRIGVSFPPARISIASESQRQQASLIYEQFRSEEEKRQRYSRRDFFRHLRDRALTSSAQEQPGPAEVDAGNRHPTQKARLLIQLLSKFARKESAGERVPGFMEIRVDDQCTGCGACAVLCPTGALAVNATGSALRLQWTPAHCSQCGLCFEVCGRKALHGMDCLDPSRIAGELTSIVHAISYRKCRDCGESFLSDAASPLCGRCARQGDFMNDLSQMIHGRERRTIQ